MRLEIIEKRKADNYTGDSITYKLEKCYINEQISLLQNIFKLTDFKPLKVKVEYLDTSGQQQVDSTYSKNLEVENYLKYNEILFAKIKGYIENTKISFSVDFNSEYIRIKSDYTDDFGEKDLENVINLL